MLTSIGRIGLGFGSAAAQPSAPSLSLADGGDGESFVATVSSGVGTVQLYYRQKWNTAWLTGGTRSGSGALTQSGLSVGWFEAYAVNVVDDVESAPSNLVNIQVQSTTPAPVTTEFDDVLIATAAEFLERFGETVTYVPYGGDVREITAIVDREPLAPVPGIDSGHSDMLTVTVANSSVSGISSDEIDTGKDKISLPVRYGEAAVQKRLPKIISQDAGMLILEVR